MKQFLFVRLGTKVASAPALDKYGEECLETRWTIGNNAYFTQLSRYDIGRLVGTQTIKAQSSGWSTVAGSHCRFLDTPHNRKVLDRHKVVYAAVTGYADPNPLPAEN